MKYKLLILSLFVFGVINSQQIQSFPQIKRGATPATDSMFAVAVMGTDTISKKWLDPNVPIPFGMIHYVLDSVKANIRFQTDSAKENIRSQMLNIIANNSTETGRNLLNLAAPASPSIVRANPNGTSVTRTVPEALQDLGLDQVNNTSDANKPVSTTQQTALNNKSTIYVGLDAGANDSYVITASPAPTSYTQGMVVIFRANTQNTTGCTINVNGLGVKTIVKRVSTTPATGDILALMWRWLVYDGTNFVLMNPVVN